MMLTIISSASNIIFDVLLMVVFPLGIIGAICATISGPAISGIIAAIYFAFTKQNKLHFVKTKIRLREIGKIGGLGISELITNLALSTVSMVVSVAARAAGSAPSLKSPLTASRKRSQYSFQKNWYRFWMRALNS